MRTDSTFVGLFFKALQHKHALPARLTHWELAATSAMAVTFIRPVITHSAIYLVAYSVRPSQADSGGLSL